MCLTWSLGEYGETSDGVKKLLDQLVESRVTSLGLRMGSLEASKEMRQVTDYLRPLCVLMSSAFWIGCCNSRRGTRPGWQEKTVGKERSTPGWRGKLNGSSFP